MMRLLCLVVGLTAGLALPAGAQTPGLSPGAMFGPALLNSADVQASCPALVNAGILDPADPTTWTVTFASTPSPTCQSIVDNIKINLPPVPPTSMQLVSIIYPALNGTYPIDAATVNTVQATSYYISVHGGFPGGVTIMPLADTSGQLHNFPTIQAWQQFATALEDFATRVRLGQNPTQPVSIP